MGRLVEAEALISVESRSDAAQPAALRAIGS
jgi:hypothetical protein